MSKRSGEIFLFFWKFRINGFVYSHILTRISISQCYVINQVRRYVELSSLDV